MWTPNAVIGLLCLVAAAIVPWLVGDGDAGRGMGSALTVLGGMLVGWAPAAPGIKRPGSGDGQSGLATLELAAVAAAAAIVAVGLVALFGGGCGATRIAAENTVTLDVTPGPPCVIVVRADGEVVSTVRGPNRCAVVVAP